MTTEPSGPPPRPMVEDAIAYGQEVLAYLKEGGNLLDLVHKDEAMRRDVTVIVAAMVDSCARHIRAKMQAGEPVAEAVKVALIGSHATALLTGARLGRKGLL